MSSQPATLAADVVIVGGGPAGAWAALKAKSAGAERVVLVDKGACGTSGATASANTGVWYVPPEPELRERSIASRVARGGGLARPELMAAVLDATYVNLAELERWGYPFPTDDSGKPYRANLRGPDYMAFMRRMLKKAHVKVWDYSPALELLVEDGSVSGVAGYRLQENQAYSIQAAAVVLACGGVAYLSKTLGCDVNTGDGLLMAVEAGAQLSGMEFSAQYGICPAYSSVTKGLPYLWATFSDEAGNVLDIANNRMLGVAEALQRGRVFAVLDKASPDVQDWLRRGQPNCFLPHDRLGIDPFKERFPVTLRCEGTVRGTGGIRLRADDGSTDVPGLFAAGDAASREGLTGVATGGGAPNAAWAISSGSWAGQGAAVFAKGVSNAARAGRPVGGAGLRPSDSVKSLPARELVTVVQAEVLPLEKNLFRRGAQLERSLATLDSAWRDARAHLAGEGASAVRTREAASLLAAARFAYRSALARPETRGLHLRRDFPESAPTAVRLRARGLDSIEIHPEAVSGA